MQKCSQKHKRMEYRMYISFFLSYYIQYGAHGIADSAAYKKQYAVNSDSIKKRLHKKNCEPTHYYITSHGQFGVFLKIDSR